MNRTVRIHIRVYDSDDPDRPDGRPSGPFASANLMFTKKMVAEIPGGFGDRLDHEFHKLVPDLAEMIEAKSTPTRGAPSAKLPWLAERRTDDGHRPS